MGKCVLLVWFSVLPSEGNLYRECRTSHVPKAFHQLSWLILVCPPPWSSWQHLELIQNRAAGGPRWTSVMCSLWCAFLFAHFRRNVAGLSPPTNLCLHAHCLLCHCLGKVPSLQAHLGSTLSCGAISRVTLSVEPADRTSTGTVRAVHNLVPNPFALVSWYTILVVPSGVYQAGIGMAFITAISMLVLYRCSERLAGDPHLAGWIGDVWRRIPIFMRFEIVLMNSLSVISWLTSWSLLGCGWLATLTISYLWLQLWFCTLSWAQSLSLPCHVWVQSATPGSPPSSGAGSLSRRLNLVRLWIASCTSLQDQSLGLIRFLRDVSAARVTDLDVRECGAAECRARGSCFCIRHHAGPAHQCDTANVRTFAMSNPDEAMQMDHWVLTDSAAKVFAFCLLGGMARRRVSIPSEGILPRKTAARRC